MGNRPLGRGSGTISLDVETGKEQRRTHRSRRNKSAVHHPIRKYGKGGPKSHKVQGGKTALITLDNIDQRSKAAQAYRRLVSGVVHDLGGDDVLSVIERSLVMAFASAAIKLQDLSARALCGQDIDWDAHASAISSMVRTASRLGLERRPRDLPSYNDYLTELKADDDLDAEVVTDDGDS